MPLGTFDKLLPWTGALAGVAWIGATALRHTSARDVPGGASAQFITGHLGLNYGSQACLVLMGICLLFFATSLRNLLRSGEAQEGTYSNIAYGGLVVAAAGVSQMVVWGWAEMNGAADAGDQAAVHVLDYGSYFAWAGMGIGLAAALVAAGLGGIRSTMLPKWFAGVSVVLGALGALGNAGIPPGGLVTYILLPLWLVVAATVVARRQRSATSSPDLMATVSAGSERG